MSETSRMADIEDDPIHDKPMPLLEHLLELRRRLLWSVIAFFLCFFGSYYFAGGIYYILAEPLAHVMRATGNTDPHLIYTQLYEAFFTKIKLAFFGAAFISFPVIAWQLYLFVAPGLYRSEKRALLPFLIATPVLFIMGASLAYFVVFPFAWRFFASFQTPTGAGGMPIELLPRMSDYLDLVMKLIFAFGITFQVPVALSLLAKVGIVTSNGLKRFRRYAYVGMFVIAAILAPPDVVTQCSLALPLVLLYEISIISAKFLEPKPVEA